MTTNLIGATNEILASIKGQWDVKSAAIVGYIPRIYWPNEDDGQTPDCAKFWARVHLQSVSCGQSIFGESIVIQGARRYTTDGLIFFEIYSPKRADAENKCSQLAQLAQGILRLSTLNVTLRKAVIKNLDPENGSVRKTVLAEFQFDEIN